MPSRPPHPAPPGAAPPPPDALPADHAVVRRAAALGGRAPAWLRARGAPPAREPFRAVAVVGTRAADRDALAFARDVGRALAAAGVWVVSGGARGIDRAAHEGAAAAGPPARTLVVLANGLDRPHPPAHRRLFDALVDAGGALVTEHPDGAAPYPSRFLERNRLVAALADRVLVVQAPERSGALSTAAWARRLRRPLHVVPAAPWDPRGGGNGALLASGAAPCRDPRDLLAALGVDTPAPKARAAAPEPPADPDAARVWRTLAARPRHADALAEDAGLDAPRVQRALLLLALDGRAEDRGGGRWARVPRRRA